MSPRWILVVSEKDTAAQAFGDRAMLRSEMVKYTNILWLYDCFCLH